MADGEGTGGEREMALHAARGTAYPIFYALSLLTPHHILCFSSLPPHPFLCFSSLSPQPDLDEEVVETEDGKQDLKEEGGGTGRESEACELRSPLYSFSDACEELEEEEEEEVGEGGDGREEKVLFDCPSLYFAGPPSTSPSQPSVLPPYFHAFSTAFASPFCRQLPTTTPRREGEEEEAQDKARQAASVDSAVAHYVKRRMSYDVFLTLQELVV